MANGKIGKRAIVVKSSVPNSRNLMKIFTPLRLASKEEALGSGLKKNQIVWFTDTKFYRYREMNGEFFLSQQKDEYIYDSQIRTLPDLDESEQTVTEKVTELNKE
ncbi:hypothetical protein [Synechococcus phage BUCT-ZZ01]|nr:hypothetical protein [Synechococcus phage BUCT-ZZ01]